MKKAIVTGGTGFIGSWLVGELLSQDVLVTVIVRKREGIVSKLREKSNLRIIYSEISDVDSSGFDLDIPYDVFFHLAWGVFHLKIKTI